MDTTEKLIDSSTMDDNSWDLLLMRIRAGRCTPFLGAGVNFGYLPLGGEIALEWSDKFGYPIKNEIGDLSRVAQFVATEFGDSSAPKEKIIELLAARLSPPPYGTTDEPLTALAKLPFRIYLTTNYDDLLFDAFDKQTDKHPKRDICKWYSSLKVPPSVLVGAFEATTDTPVIYHLHGHNSIPESLVLTEDDFLDFLIHMAQDRNFLPPAIQAALTGTLLFIGYRLADINFRVLFRGLKYVSVLAGRKKSIAVQLPIDPNAGDKEKAESFIMKYLGKVDVTVYWGDTRTFTKELTQRWEKLYGPL